MWVEMNVYGLAMDPSTNTPLVILKDQAKKQTVPIWIGAYEASAIASQLENVEMARPMTHDLLRKVVGDLGGTLLRIEVSELKDNTFFANLVIESTSGDQVQVDARPSDAIALALRCKAPIMVSEQVIAKSGEVKIVSRGSASPKDKEKWAEILKSLSDDAFGKYKQ